VAGAPLLAATKLLPSAEEAMARQSVIGALVRVQLWADADLEPITAQPTTATASSRGMVFMVWERRRDSLPKGDSQFTGF